MHPLVVLILMSGEVSQCGSFPMAMKFVRLQRFLDVDKFRRGGEVLSRRTVLPEGEIFTRGDFFSGAISTVGEMSARNSFS